MVTEKNSDVQHDFFTDGIRLKLEGDWLKVTYRIPACHSYSTSLPGFNDCLQTEVSLLQADGTTLGAGNFHLCH